MTSLTQHDILAWLLALQEVYSENKTYLTELDSAIGDADHGINMDRGFTAVKTELEKASFPDIGAVFKTVAMTLIKTVGGASGPLFGTLFLRASTACSGKTELQASDLVELFDLGVEGIIQRGKAQLEDKTMLDTLIPVVQAMQQALQSGTDLSTLLREAATTAETGMKSTIPLQARKGRASYLGERSIGHQDPGATSAYLLLNTACDVWCN
ncbi:dihydroxyacetone kinase subunit L [candidate division KSB3 bacterium]|uniref:Dihydroxyacetone kinase subunit L n=1 Tax=candidate division KSB3 bacterium TaxID=2044937 RepID=A0A2G6KH29_9BACT|nr:MAG: dihydroxyacetone kinase subunit L [candidate division KSB3 bacterium]